MSDTDKDRSKAEKQAETDSLGVGEGMESDTCMQCGSGWVV